ncbi:hypothetical protein M9H77_18668 [Catharanthus roseus]|uniref:Uncharacterized protein n=1 Tax=Catharanthus roseus TaxID=4058 RepID=A0ACC0B8B2_CATRO|nr:hypothetical protein M9H77_18668 [Catharanthus roseus]
MRRLAKGPIFPEDPGMTLTSPPEVAVTKRRKKTNSIKRDKSHWSTCQLLIKKYKSQVDLVLVLVLPLDLDHGPVRVLGRDPVGEGDRHEILGERAEGATVAEVVYLLCNWKNVIDDGNYGYRVVTDFVFSDEHQWPKRYVLMSSFIGYIASFYDCVTSVFILGLTRRYIGYWSLDRITTLYSVLSPSPTVQLQDH